MKAKMKVNNIFAIIGTLILLFIYPLFMTNKYFNITLAKFEFFTLVSAVFAMLSYLTESSKPSNVKNKKKEIKSEKKKIDYTDLSYLCIIIFGAITVLVSGHAKAAFLGTAGRYMGYAFFLAAGLAYLFISRHNILKEYELIAFEVSMALACLLGFVQACGADPFNLIGSIAKYQRTIFISTFGNIDVFSAFLAISLPISLFMICFRNRKSPITYIYFVTAIFGCFGLFLSNSDSGYLGVIVAFWVICLLSFKNRKFLYQFSDLCLYFFLLAFIYGQLHSFGIVTRDLSFMSEILTNPLISCGAIVVFLLASILLRVIKLNDKALKALKTIYIVVSVFIVLSVIALIIYFSAINTDYDLGSFASYFRFNDKWGTNRKFVWRIYLQAYNELPFVQKVFGCGQDCLKLALSTELVKEMVDFGNYTNNAHNEYLQYFVSIGIFGLVSYLAFIITGLIKLFKEKEYKMLTYPMAVAIISYLAQATVNITQPIVTPLVFLFIAFACCKKATWTSDKLDDLTGVNI